MKTTVFMLILLVLGVFVYAKETETLITVSLDAPNPGYSVNIESVFQNPQCTFIHAHINKPDSEMNYAAVITTIKDRVRIPRKTANVKVYITGKDWNWSAENDYIFIEDKKEYEKITKGLTPIKILK